MTINYDCKIKIGSHSISETDPVFIIAEIGINHNGNLEIAKRLIDAAVAARCNAVKFQKRTPKLCVPAAPGVDLQDKPLTILGQKPRNTSDSLTRRHPGLVSGSIFEAEKMLK